MTGEHRERADFYERYLQRRNEHRFEELGEFVAQDVNGTPQGLVEYAAGLRDVVDAFPDYGCQLQQLLVGGDWLAARHHDAPDPSSLTRKVIGIPGRHHQ